MAATRKNENRCRPSGGDRRSEFTADEKAGRAATRLRRPGFGGRSRVQVPQAN